MAPTNLANAGVTAGVVHTRVPFAAGAVEVKLIRTGATLIDIVGANVNATETYYYNSNPITYYGQNP